MLAIDRINPPGSAARDRLHLRYWTALGWTVLTLGIYSFYVFYQLVRRMRDHNARRVESSTRPWPSPGRRPEGGGCRKS